MALLLFAKELNKRAKEAYIAVSVHPGIIFSTNLLQHFPKWKLAMFKALKMTGMMWLLTD